MRQHGPVNHVADGIDAGNAGAEMVVNGNPSSGVDLDAHLFKAKALQEGSAT